MDLVLTSETIGQDDQRWLGSQHGVAHTQTVTLDASLFVLATHFPNGYLPSGTVLAKFTATGRYGPYTTGAANGLQTALGVLLIPVKIATATSQPSGPLLNHGRVVLAYLPFQSGTGSIDATGRGQLTQITWV